MRNVGWFRIDIDTNPDMAVMQDDQPDQMVMKSDIGLRRMLHLMLNSQDDND